eukprot:2147879-Alexandrium_andersonii.AAC.1
MAAALVFDAVCVPIRAHSLRRGSHRPSSASVSARGSALRRCGSAVDIRCACLLRRSRESKRPSRGSSWLRQGRA